MAFAALIFTPHNLLVILHIYLYLSTLNRDVLHRTPESLNYKTLSDPRIKEFPNLHNPCHCTSPKPLSPSLKLLRGLNIAMNFSISMVLISLSNDVATNLGPICSFALPPPNVQGLKISHINT